MIRNFAIIFCFITTIFISSCASQNKSIAISTSTLNGKTFQLTNMFEGRGITISFYNEEFYGYSGFNTYLGKDNSELIHLQTRVSNLQELQQDDIINYVQLDNNTLSTLTTILTKIIQKQRVVA